jgi:hypothetical protein
LKPNGMTKLNTFPHATFSTVGSSYDNASAIPLQTAEETPRAARRVLLLY